MHNKIALKQWLLPMTNPLYEDWNISSWTNTATAKCIAS